MEALLEGWIEQRLARWSVLRRLILAAWGGPRKLLKRMLRHLMRRGAGGAPGRVAAAPRASDIVLLPDAFWTSGIVSTLEAGAADGAFIVPLIHDVIPLTHPQFFGAAMVREYTGAFQRLMALSGAALAVSHATRGELEAWLTSQPGRRKGLPMEVAHNGADLAARPAAGTIRAGVLALEGAEYFLMVGTLEPRKGQLVVLDAFEALWPAGETARLVLAGRIGWGMGDIMRRIGHSPHAGSRLIALHDATDAELDWLYRHATAVILASAAEGFGLPLVEAMHHGVPVISSDIPVFREVGGDYPVYFRPGQPGALGEAIAALRARLPAGNRPTPRPWPTWDEAALEMVRKAITLRDRVRGAPAS
jgi:alpha-1,2-rhamnosyltransferase